MLPFKPRDLVDVAAQGKGGPKGLMHGFLVEDGEGAWWGGREGGKEGGEVDLTSLQLNNNIRKRPRVPQA